LKAKTAAELGA